jgi:hypothetical protein
VLILGPEVVACCAALYLAIQRMPTAQRQALEQFARQAAHYVEWQHAVATTDKKTLAIAYATDMFRLCHLPVPHEDLLEIAVVAALHEIQHG